MTVLDVYAQAHRDHLIAEAAALRVRRDLLLDLLPDLTDERERAAVKARARALRNLAGAAVELSRRGPGAP